MDNTIKKAKIEEAVRIFRNYLTEQVDLDSLAEYLDKLELEYAMLLIDQVKEGFPARSERLYVLHELKSICRLKDPNLIVKAN